MMHGVTGETVICMVCMADHFFDRRGRQTIVPGVEACAVALELDIIEGGSAAARLPRFHCPTCLRPIALHQMQRLGRARRRWRHDLDCPPVTKACHNCGYALSLPQLRALLTCPACEALFDGEDRAA